MVAVILELDHVVAFCSSIAHFVATLEGIVSKLKDSDDGALELGRMLAEG
jgi:hypothetical protein